MTLADAGAGLIPGEPPLRRKSVTWLISGAQHSLDRGTGIEIIRDASVSPAAQTTYLADGGAFIHPLAGIAKFKLGDRDLTIYTLMAAKYWKLQL